MIQPKLHLSKDLQLALKDSDELWVAVALMSDAGYRFLQENTAHMPIQHYLLGVDLPTSPHVLKNLQQKNQHPNIESKVYFNHEVFFHPKVYLIKSGDRLTAFLGSGNCTEGGLSKNIEFNVKVEDNDFCMNILKWFNALYKQGVEITDAFLNQYTLLYNKRLIRQQADKEEVKIYFPSKLESIDFSQQFFRKEHFEAFTKEKRRSRSEQSNNERIAVRNHLYKLHTILYPEIKTAGWDLHEHYKFDDVVSSAEHGFTSAELGGLWLHYGRNKEEIKMLDVNGTPLDFMRLQVIVHEDNVGISNRIGKDKGSIIDRQNLHKKMKYSTEFREIFYSYVTALPEGYFVRLAGEKKYASEFKSPEQFTEYILKDDINHYFVIGIELHPGNPLLSEDNIVKTIMENFKVLLPGYNLIKQ